MDEVTGLHAFDDLDPVSALNVLPERPESQPPQRSPAARPAVHAAVHAARPAASVSSAPRPPAPAFRGRSLPPPPPPRGGPAGLSVPPPPPMRSFPPPKPDAAVAPHSAAPARPTAAPRAPVASPSSPSWEHARAAARPPGQTPAPQRQLVRDDDLTQRVALPLDQLSAFEDDTQVRAADFDAASVMQGASNGYAAEHLGHDGAHGLTDMSSTSVAASIDMDWDEDEEPQTNMRDELQPARASASDFDAIVHVPATAPASFSPPAAAAARPSMLPASGQPSPFGYEAVDEPQSWEDDAQTRIHPGSLAPQALAPQAGFGAPTMEPSWARAPAVTEDSFRDDEPASKLRIGLPWLALAAVVLVGIALGARSMMAPPALATVTLVTEPATAEVSVDGRPLVGQSSPFTIQGLAPASEHFVVVRADGHAEQKVEFRVDPGETKALDTITLEPMQLDTGVVLASQPAGARVLIDGVARDATTPARVTDLEPGLHTVRLEAAGFLPWETQVAVAAGQVVELSAAQMIPTSVSASQVRSDDGRADERRDARRARRLERRAERAASRGAAVASHSATQQPARRAAAVAAPAPKAASAPVAVAGGGTLRVNSRPWSQVFVNGKLVGNTPQLGIPLSAGNHKIKLVSPDLGLTKQMSVRITKGQVTTKVVNLVE